MVLSVREKQRRNFAYGNTSMHNPSITRKLVDEVADHMRLPWYMKDKNGFPIELVIGHPVINILRIIIHGILGKVISRMRNWGI